MKKPNRRNQKSAKADRRFVTAGRWLPTDNTRPTVFADKRKTANKAACRGRVTWA